MTLIDVVSPYCPASSAVSLSLYVLKINLEPVRELVLLVQIATYTFAQRTKQDPVGVRSLVYALALIELLHEILVCSSAYIYAVTQLHTDDKFQYVSRITIIEIPLNGIVIFIVQGFLIYRVWCFRTLKWLVFLDASLSVCQVAIVIVFTVKAAPASMYLGLGHLKWLSIALAVLTTTSDLCIVVTQTAVFYRIGAFDLHRSKLVMQRIVLLSMITGLLPGLCALGFLLSVIICPNTFVHIAFFSCITGLYGNVMMLTLNTRDYLRDCDLASDNLSMPDFASVTTPKPETGIGSLTSLRVVSSNSLLDPGDQKLESSASGQAEFEGLSYPEPCHVISA
ncbi:hypothetical protein CPB83DRAFT_900326 [Crepidotus variabilis]|uniref:DUF6534 domain-containing protein n=1 Tax=Crepidotus variabilis TaxID=179855 RepID=A0A9P6JI06_9AGAR|nr:hypothetical protein CPB83DRAFT_900326 [Crepidotus variabilis]